MERAQGGKFLTRKFDETAPIFGRGEKCSTWNNCPFFASIENVPRGTIALCSPYFGLVCVAGICRLLRGVLKVPRNVSVPVHVRIGSVRTECPAADDDNH